MVNPCVLFIVWLYVAEYEALLLADTLGDHRRVDLLVTGSDTQVGRLPMGNTRLVQQQSG